MGVLYVPVRKIKSNYILNFKYSDPLILPTREKGPKRAFFALQKLFSKTGMDIISP